VIDDENADHDADQQRRQKKIFHFIDPFALQSRTIHATEKFVGVGMRPPLPTWQLTFHGPELINPACAGTIIVRKLEKAGQSPAFSSFWFRPISDGVNYSVVVVTDAVDVPADWPASAGRFAQAEKPNAATQAMMRTIRI
jgi:hypothetical protein